MEDWQTRLFLEAQAELVRVEGMKAENGQRQHLRQSMAYDESAFYDSAAEIDRIVTVEPQGELWRQG